jgi:hypothetical protein
LQDQDDFLPPDSKAGIQTIGAFSENRRLASPFAKVRIAGRIENFFRK